MSISQTTLPGSHTLPPGTVIQNKWILLEFIAKGGMGEVYRAHQTNLKRDVAIKIISPGWIETFQGDNEELETALTRFHREVEAMASVRHPCVLQVYDHGIHKEKESGAELEFIVMEFVPGKTLRDTMSESGFDPEDVLAARWLTTCFIPLLQGVKAIHNAGIIHRDLKPENVLMDGKAPKITDFGLARSGKWQGLTQTMEMMGTLKYMPPEHLEDVRQADQLSDVYSLGKILFEAMAGNAAMKPLVFKQAKLSSPETPFFEAISQIVEKATHEDPTKRTPSVDALLQDIHEALRVREEPAPTRQNPKAHPFLSWAVASLFIALCATLFWHFSEKRPSDMAPPAPPVAKRQIKGDVTTESVLAENNTTMFRVPPSPEGDPAFFMAETQVTNLQFVAFLNDQSRNRVIVKENKVYGDGNLWMDLKPQALPNHTNHETPIAFKEGQFALTNGDSAACPVVNVSGYAALAYTDFYGKDLPTHAQWAAVAVNSVDVSGGISLESLSFPFPVLVFPPNDYGIRGVNTPVMTEWLFPSSVSKTGISMAEPFRHPNATLETTYPDVGFRMVGQAPNTQ